MSIAHAPSPQPLRPQGGRGIATVAAAGAAAVVATLLGVAACFAADPAPTVKPRATPRPADQDRGGAGPNHAKKPGERPAGEEVRVFAKDSPVAVVREAFRCALERGEEAGFDCYAALNVMSNRDNDNARTHLRRYSWSHFRKWAPTYPLGGKDFGILVTRQVPAKLAADTREVKLFVWSRQRDNPAPITLRREAGSWRIFSNSL